VASTYPADSTGAAIQLLEHPVEHEGARHRMPRQSRGTAPLIGVTAMTAALGATAFAAAPAAQAGQANAVTTHDEASETILSADPGLALAARIQQQADSQRTAAEENARLAAAHEAEAKRAAQVEAKRTALALPVASYELTAHFADAGVHWSHLHTGLDFAARTGTKVTAIGAGTITSAGWSGSYGYRVIQTLPDGTEIWYCHLSRITVASGQVASGTVIGAVGATGNATGPHLHFEVRPGGGAPIDPLSWLQARGLNP